MTSPRAPFEPFTSRVIPFPAENVDTDQIVPARFLKMTDRWGLSEALFADWRFEEDGGAKPGFILNRREMQGRKILLAGGKLGGRSRRGDRAGGAVGGGGWGGPSAGVVDIFRLDTLLRGL